MSSLAGVSYWETRLISCNCIHTRFFSKNTTFFSKWQPVSSNDNFFLQNLQNSPECSEKHSYLTVRTSDWNYPILEMFLIFITKHRFGCVGAPEGRKVVPDIHTRFFSKTSVSDIPIRLGLRPSPKIQLFFHIFLQKTIFSPKCNIFLHNAKKSPKIRYF